jgi:hypothetical protein
LAILGQKAWTIAPAFDRFWLIFTPFQLFSIIFKGAKNMQFGSFLAKKHGLYIAPAFDRFWLIFTSF